MDAPGWLERARRHCWVMCPGAHPLVLSLRFGPVDDDDPDSRWDWGFVGHHPEDCAVLDDPDAQDDLGNAVLAEIGEQVDCAVRKPDHTAIAAP